MRGKRDALSYRRFEISAFPEDARENYVKPRKMAKYLNQKNGTSKYIIRKYHHSKLTLAHLPSLFVNFFGTPFYFPEYPKLFLFIFTILCRGMWYFAAKKKECSPAILSHLLFQDDFLVAVSHIKHNRVPWCWEKIIRSQIQYILR